MLVKETLYTPYNGAVLLENPLLNKGLAFTEGKERRLISVDCFRIMLKLSKNKRSARGSSSVNLSAIFPGISICGIFRILTRHYFIIYCAAI